MTQKAKSPDTGATKDYFELPRTVWKEINKCAAYSTGENTIEASIRFLWMNIADRTTDAPPGTSDGVLNVEDWLNVIDEAASLGVCCIVICTGDALQENPSLWTICDWAQRIHGLDVGIHARCAEIGPKEIEALKRLDRAHTWLFVNSEAYGKLAALEHEHIRVRIADVCAEDHEPPCEMPDSLVFVAPDGNLYTCGLVLGNDQYRLGHIMERPLNSVIGDPDLPHFIPKSVPHRENGCAGCPPILAKRMAEESNHPLHA